MRHSDQRRISVRRMTLLAVCTALIFGLQVAMSALPNIELVSLLILLYTLAFGRDTLFVIYAFALLEGLVYGFGIWWTMYLYVWTILWAVVTLLRRWGSRLLWAFVLGIFGLCFGALCAIPYVFYGGIRVAVAWWVAGIPYDLIHCGSNFLLGLVLYPPLSRVPPFRERKGQQGEAN